MRKKRATGGGVIAGRERAIRGEVYEEEFVWMGSRVIYDEDVYWSKCV